MVTVKKATQNDFEKLLPLLFELDSRKQTQDEWQRLFRAPWDDHKNYFGYVMYDGENAVGFLGLLFSQRILNDSLIKFCNITSWVVKKKYRRQSLIFYSRSSNSTTTLSLPSLVTLEPTSLPRN